MDNGIPAVRISRLRGGKIYALHVLMYYEKPVSGECAIERVQAGKTAFVCREDEHRVLDALGVPSE